MIGCLLAAPASGSGKTTLTCALLALLAKRGLDPCAFKCGPDYIDPMFHRSVLGVPSHNLDLFLSDESTVRALYARYAAGHGAAVVEGAMGFYDGVGGSTPEAGAWHLANTLNLPVLLVLRPGGSCLTLAALIRGLQTFRAPSHIAGVLLNECSPSMAAALAPVIRRETGLPVLGWLPPMPEARFPSRHLGIYTAAEVQDLTARIDALADQLGKTLDWPAFLAACQQPDIPPAHLSPRPGTPVRLAVARDEAFCFCYEETLDALRDAGAELCFFSPLRDAALPARAAGLYLPGGYPELHAPALALNTAMRRAVARAVAQGMPTVAECGGFLYLGKSLEDTGGRHWPMAGALPGAGYKKGRLVRFGYARITAETSGLLLEAGQTAPIHEFHHWDSTACGTDFTARKPVSGRSWGCGFSRPGLYAAFGHLYMAGTPGMAARFVNAARQWAGIL